MFHIINIYIQTIITKNLRSSIHQYLRKILSTSASTLSLLIESLKATYEATLEAANSAFNLDLLIAFSV